MSRKSRSRNPRRTMVVAPRSIRASTSALPPEQRLVIEHARDLPQLADPFDAELVTGQVLTEAALSVSSTPMLEALPPGVSITLPGGVADPPATPDPSALTFEGSTEHGLWAGVIGHVSAMPSRRGLALLRAMAALLPDADTAARAATQADALADHGLQEPSWARAVLDLRPAECWIFDDQVGSGYVAVVCSYRYGDRQHALAVFIDHMMGGVAKNALATTKLDDLLAQFPLEPTPAETAHRTVADAYRLTYAHPELPVDPDVHRLRMLVHRRVQRHRL